MGLRSLFLMLGVLFSPISKASFGQSRAEIMQMIDASEKRHGLPQGLLKSIVQVESNFKVKAFNSHENPGVAISSYGLGQLTIATAQYHCKLPPKNIFDAKKNLDCSARVLKFQLRRYRRHMNKAIAAYQWGTPCMCDGVFFRRQGGKYRICRWIGTKDPMICSKRNLFYNQNYVDNVLNNFLFKYHRF